MILLVVDRHSTERIVSEFTTAEPDLITVKNLAFPSKSSRNKNDSNLMIAIP